jgi:hypothetical protein
LGEIALFWVNDFGSLAKKCPVVGGQKPRCCQIKAPLLANKSPVVGEKMALRCCAKREGGTNFFCFFATTFKKKMYICIL